MKKVNKAEHHMPPMEPTLQERVQWAARDLARAAIEANSGLKKLETRLAREALAGAKKVTVTRKGK